MLSTNRNIKINDYMISHSGDGYCADGLMFAKTDKEAINIFKEKLKNAPKNLYMLFALRDEIPLIFSLGKD